MSISLEDVKVALSIIENNEGSEIKLRSGDVEIIVRRGSSILADTETEAIMPAPITSTSLSLPPSPSTAKTQQQAVDGKHPAIAPSPTAIPLRAPLSGVIYRSPSPEEPPFVEMNAEVDADTIVCIIDVMKVMNLISSPASGQVIRIDAKNGELIAKDDVILWVEPR